MGLSRKMRRRKRAYTLHADGSKSIPVHPKVAEIFEQKRREFVAKFGREPGPHDPIFFDPDSDTPQLRKVTMEDVRKKFELMESVGLRPALIHASKMTGRMVTKENSANLTDEELQEWEDAAAEGRDLHADGPCRCEPNAEYHGVNDEDDEQPAIT